MKQELIEWNQALLHKIVNEYNIALTSLFKLGIISTPNCPQW